MTPDDGAGRGGTRARRAAKDSGAGQTATPPRSGTTAQAAATKTTTTSKASTTSSPSSTGRTGGGPPKPKGPASGRRQGALDPDTMVALEEERDFLLESLDDLEREHDAGDVDDVDYVELKDDYTARAAASIRALDRHAEVMASAKRERSWPKIVAVLVVVALVAGLAGWLVAASSGQRDPGGSVSGDIRSSSLGEIQNAKGFTGQAQQAMSEGNPEQAVELFQQALASYRAALEIDPNNVEALTYQGWLLHNLYVVSGGAEGGAQAEQFEQGAIDSLNQALEIDPTYPDALVFRAVIAMRQGRAADALVDLNALPADSLPSEMRSLVDGVREDAQAAVDGVTTTTTATG